MRFLYEFFFNKCYVHGTRLNDIVAGPFCKQCDAEAELKEVPYEPIGRYNARGEF